MLPMMWTILEITHDTVAVHHNVSIGGITELWHDNLTHRESSPCVTVNVHAG